MAGTKDNIHLSNKVAEVFGTRYCRTCNKDRPTAGFVERKGRPGMCAWCAAKIAAHANGLRSPS
jgi:hypothetical protein